MKRKISLILVVILLLGSFSPVFGDDENSPWYGTWEITSNWGKVTYVTVIGDTLYGAYYHGSGTLKGTVTGKITGNVMEGTWSQSPDGSPDGGTVWTLLPDGTMKVTWGTGSQSTGTRNTGTPSTIPMDKSKIRYTQGSDPSRPNPVPGGASQTKDPMNGTYTFTGDKGNYVLRVQLDRDGRANLKLIAMLNKDDSFKVLNLKGQLYNSAVTVKIASDHTLTFLMRSDGIISVTEEAVIDGEKILKGPNDFKRWSGNDNLNQEDKKIYEECFGAGGFPSIPGKASINGTYTLTLDYGNYAIRVKVEGGKGQFKLVYNNDWEGLGEEKGTGTYANKVYNTEVKEGLAYEVRLREDGNVDLIEKVLKSGQLVDQGPFLYKKFNDNDNINASKEEIYEECFGKGAKPETVPDKPVKKPGSGNAEEVPATGGSDKDATKVHNGSTGVAVKFPDKGVLGYRLFRSTVKGERGISVTDFYITGTSFVDVNVKPNTTYYYTLVPVLAEAKPFEGIDEKLGEPIATWTVTTSGNVDEGFVPGQTRHFILLQIDNPQMTVDGVVGEVDPGRGTKPMVYRNRTMVPIRAIVEALGGSAGWDAEARKVSLKARGNTVEMWIDKKEFIINGKKSEMDVVPMITNSRTFVPLRFAIENLNSKVDWLNSTREVVIAWSE